MQATYFANPLVTARKKLPTGGTIDGYGGAVVASASNTRINTLHDIKDAVIGIQLQSGWASSILQQGLLIRNGISIFRDAKQIISGDLGRDYTQLQILRDIHSGLLDIGFIRADNLYIMEMRNQTRRSYFKIIAEAPGTLVPGTADPYPFPITTAIYPEWGLVAFPSVDRALKWDVLTALLRISPASPPAIAGGYDSWEPALEYAPALQV